MPVGPASPEELAALGARIDAWAERERAENPALAAVDFDRAAPDGAGGTVRRWYVRLRGEEKLVITVWLTLRERSLHYETYFMPAPEENSAACYEYLLRLNCRLVAMRFAIGLEDAVYLVGQVPVSAVDDAELDRIVGSAYAYSEQFFRPAMRIGYASRF